MNAVRAGLALRAADAIGYGHGFPPWNRVGPQGICEPAGRCTPDLRLMSKSRREVRGRGEGSRRKGPSSAGAERRGASIGGARRQGEGHDEEACHPLERHVHRGSRPLPGLERSGGSRGRGVHDHRNPNGRGAGSGSRPRQTSTTTGRTERLATGFNPYPGSQVADGVRVATGDFDGDLNEDLVVSAGNGLAVKIFELNPDGTVGNLIDSRKVFGGRGVFVAAGDLNGDQRAELIVAAGYGTPNVRIFSDTDFDGRVLDNQTDGFLAFPSGFRGGVRVAAADTNDVGAAEVITASASAGRRIKILTDRRPRPHRLRRPAARGRRGLLQLVQGWRERRGRRDLGRGRQRRRAGDRARGRQGQGLRPHRHRRGRRRVRQPSLRVVVPRASSGWSRGVRLGAGDSDHSGSYVEVFTAPAALAGRKAVKIYDDTLDPGRGPARQPDHPGLQGLSQIGEGRRLRRPGA